MPPETQETCWTVLRAATNGDAAARSYFGRCYLGPIRDYLVHRWRSSRLLREVDDATQEVFVECLKPGGVLERADPERGSFRGLLYSVVRNTARRFEERAANDGRRRPEEDVYLDELPAQEEALSKIFDKMWARALLQEAVLRHAAEARARRGDYRRRYRILRLRHQKGLPVREIAAELEEPDVDVIHNDYRRARREFRGFLRDVVAVHTGARGDAIDKECQRLMEFVAS